MNVPFLNFFPNGYFSFLISFFWNFFSNPVNLSSNLMLSESLFF